jgi:hypothetical protein
MKVSVHGDLVAVAAPFPERIVDEVVKRERTHLKSPIT